MFLDGHYLNLPVVEEDGHLSAIIDVLTLTYATLEQVRCTMLSYNCFAELVTDERNDNWRHYCGRG